jgi:hypothetical protein
VVRTLRRRLLLCAPRNALSALDELVTAWRDAAVDVEIESFEHAVPDLAALVARGGARLDGALLVASARRAPATVLPAPFSQGSDGWRVPIAWLPAQSEVSLRRFAATAARVHRRAGERRGLALLGQWLPRYLHVTDRMKRIVGEGGVRAFRWTGDAITRESMVGALGCGLGLGLYVGHGRAMGWVGYHGVRAHHFDAEEGRAKAAPPREPMGAILSLCCRTASRRRVALSYAESLALQGVAAASFGAIGDTLHSDNTRWAVGICDALAQGASTVGELLLRAAPASPAALSSYRLIGDPLAPLGCDESSLRRATRVRTYE